MYLGKRPDLWSVIISCSSSTCHLYLICQAQDPRIGPYRTFHLVANTVLTKNLRPESMPPSPAYEGRGETETFLPPLLGSFILLFNKHRKSNVLQALCLMMEVLRGSDTRSKLSKFVVFGMEWGMDEEEQTRSGGNPGQGVRSSGMASQSR